MHRVTRIRRRGEVGAVIPPLGVDIPEDIAAEVYDIPRAEAELNVWPWVIAAVGATTLGVGIWLAVKR
jgi:hypothetical protein